MSYLNAVISAILTPSENQKFRMTANEVQQAQMNHALMVQARLQYEQLSGCDRLLPRDLFARQRTAPVCNCRNCGAPFEPAETACSYCRSER